MAWQRIVPVFLLTVFAFEGLSAQSDRSQSPNFSCGQVRELFEGKIGSPASLLPSPEYESETSLCRRGSADSRLSCCTLHTEERFAEAAEKKLKESLRSRNHALKKHITNTLAKYQDRLDQLTTEANNRTLVVLTRLHKVPAHAHQAAVNSFYSAILRALQSGEADSLEDVVNEFFRRLFPAVFDYVLSSQGQDAPRPSSAGYHECLQQYEKQIRPFRDVPDNLYRHLWKSFRHALLFQETLKTFTNTIVSTESVAMETECRHALVRLQVCAGCLGQSVKGAEVRSCRGMCLNVMRGCLAKVSEISSSWDDLVVAFENLQLGAMGHYELQRLLMYMDMNVSDAIMLAMDDSPRIYDEVMVKCRSLSGNSSARADPEAVPLDLSGVSDSIPQRSTETLSKFRDEVKGLIKYLDDSKGMFNRMADTLCQESSEYEQDMQSPRCWNGTAVARYTQEVPEANFLSQQRHNSEVKVSLIPDYSLLQVKDTLTHMRRNLSGLLNADMMGDDPHKHQGAHTSMTGVSSGNYHRDYIVDDEDLVTYGTSGSGSGSGEKPDVGPGTDEADRTDEKRTEPPVVRSTPTRKPPTGSADNCASSRVLLLCCLLVLTLLHTDRK